MKLIVQFVIDTDEDLEQTVDTLNEAVKRNADELHRRLRNTPLPWDGWPLFRGKKVVGKVAMTKSLTIDEELAEFLAS